MMKQGSDAETVAPLIFAGGQLSQIAKVFSSERPSE